MVKVNLIVVQTRPNDDEMKSLTESELAGIKRGLDFVEFGTGYSKEHATRPSTIGLILSSSPIALLAW